MSAQVDRAGGRHWISLGLLFGGHTHETPWPFVAPLPAELPPSYDLAGQADSAEWEMKQAGFEPEEDYPGRATRRWAVRCVTCGASMRVSLESVRNGVRCRRRHVDLP